MVPPYSTPLQVSLQAPSFAPLSQRKKFECPKPNVWPSSCAITKDESLSCKINVPLTLFAPPKPARPDQIHPAFGEYTTKYRLE